MLFLITGQPGNGKTLHTLGLVEKLRNDPASVAIGRKVYYWGIPDLVLPWEKLGTEEEWLAARVPGWDGDCPWHALPDGSIVVIDECQHVFRPRKQGAATPLRVSALETHRHRGFDIYVITQHPQLLDINVRKLVGRHIHVRRTFGQETATLLQWEVAMDPNDKGARNQALTTRWSYPKEHFAWYKSAEIHTVKKELPWKKLLLLGGSIAGVVGLGFLAAHFLGRIGDTKESKAAVEGQQLEHVVSWAPEGFKPRAEPWIWSSPFYDKVAEVKSAPRITGCMEMRIGPKRICTCSNGQGKASVSPQVCRDYMAGLIYDPLKPIEDVKAENIRRLDAAQNGNASSEGNTEGSVTPNRSGLSGS